MPEQEIHRVGTQTRSLPPQLERLLSYWLQKCDGRRMPSRDELPVQELRAWLGHLALIEISGETDFRIRLCGTNLIRRFGREATGVAVAELAFDIAKQLSAILKATSKAMTPIVALSQVPLGRTTATYCEVALPLSGIDCQMATVLFGSYPIRAG
ncbi:MAG TPA: PAS domain-containing protein [Rhizomicrobium sp.]